MEIWSYLEKQKLAADWARQDNSQEPMAFWSTASDKHEYWSRSEPVAPTSRVDLEFETPCFVWLGAMGNCRRYPRVCHAGRIRGAHRVAFERAHGPIPAGCDVHHRCGVPECVRPDHLEALPLGKHREPHRVSPDQLALCA